ncbi:hypothetical protein, partial [Serratia marcescens]|uniref:hypothetical protein n=1 Tax=Serratia marcescens TaxID=615 RepID=UPI0013CF248C
AIDALAKVAIAGTAGVAIIALHILITVKTGMRVRRHHDAGAEKQSCCLFHNFPFVLFSK